MNKEHRGVGRYVAHYDERHKRWEVRIVDRYGSLAMPAQGPIFAAHYTDCVAIIKRLERGYAPMETIG